MPSLTLLAILTGIHVDPGLARLVTTLPVEVPLILAGALLGLGIAHVMGEIDDRALARRRRPAPPSAPLASR